MYTFNSLYNIRTGDSDSVIWRDLRFQRNILGVQPRHVICCSHLQLKQCSCCLYCGPEQYILKGLRYQRNSLSRCNSNIFEHFIYVRVYTRDSVFIVRAVDPDSIFFGLVILKGAHYPRVQPGYIIFYLGLQPE